jgi:hypothetical protein
MRSFAHRHPPPPPPHNPPRLSQPRPPGLLLHPGNLLRPHLPPEQSSSRTATSEPARHCTNRSCFGRAVRIFLDLCPTPRRPHALGLLLVLLVPTIGGSNGPPEDTRRCGTVRSPGKSAPPRRYLGFFAAGSSPSPPNHSPSSSPSQNQESRYDPAIQRGN